MRRGTGQFRTASAAPHGRAGVCSKGRRVSRRRDGARTAPHRPASPIQLQSTRDPSTGTRIASAVLGISANRKGQMLAFRCSDEQPQASLLGRIGEFLGLGD